MVCVSLFPDKLAVAQRTLKKHRHYLRSLEQSDRQVTDSRVGRLQQFGVHTARVADRQVHNIRSYPVRELLVLAALVAWFRVHVSPISNLDQQPDCRAERHEVAYRGHQVVGVNNHGSQFS
jgi:hypothetical protein